MKVKKVLLSALCLVLVAAISVGATLAYLTDRDSKTNVFTVGNVSIEIEENFAQGATLVPGVNIEKRPIIRNTGNTEAWVWMTFAIPSALDNYVQGTEQGSDLNVIHWNPLGATTEDYVTEARVAGAIEKGYLPGDITYDQIMNAVAETDEDGNEWHYYEKGTMTWNVFNSLGEGKNAYQTEINGVPYNVYVMLYNKPLSQGEETLTSLYKVFLDSRVDIDPEGNWYMIVNGVPTTNDPLWTAENGNPIIYISAYGIQADGFDTVKEAYAAYQKQWGDNGEVDYPVIAFNLDTLKAALSAGKDVTLGADIEVNGNLTLAAGATLFGNGYALENVQLYMGEGSVVDDVCFRGTEAENGSLIYAHDVSVEIRNCTFVNPAWDAIQYTTATPNKSVSIVGCTFDSWEDEETGAPYRYIHIEGIGDLRANANNGVMVEILGCNFWNIARCLDDAITVAGVPEANVTVSGNGASASSEDAAKDECWFGMVENGSWVQYDVDVFEWIDIVEE